RELLINEPMVGFKGRLFFIQYLPKKPTKWGMKAYVLADSCTGYVYNWRLYTGKMNRWIWDSACNCCGIAERPGGQRSPCVHEQLLQWSCSLLRTT
ncbi:PiggyBac transposable element-derived protein 4, partial [Geodia barretti]